jgi:hypothetical protein
VGFVEGVRILVGFGWIDGGLTLGLCAGGEICSVSLFE